MDGLKQLSEFSLIKWKRKSFRNIEKNENGDEETETESI